MSETVIKISNLKKQYRLGVIGGGTLSSDLQSFWARKRGKEDPNTKIGEKNHKQGETFMALDGIDFEVKKGEALGIIGANGAGKSTLLKLLSRVTAPTEGDIWYKGRISSMLEVGTGFHGELTGRENIYMNGAILGMSKKEVDSKIEDIIEFSECRKFIDTPVKRYSSGMYVKLAFAVAAYLDAEIMVMDEVLAVGDLKFQEKCLGKMGDAANVEGRTVLYVSHNMNTIRQLCTKCMVLNKGKIIFSGDVDEAINIYMELEKGELVNFYDLNNTQRPSLDHGSKIFIKSFEFLNKEDARFLPNEKMKCEIRWTSKISIEGLRLYIAVKHADSSAIGLAQSDIFANAEEGKEKYSSFEMNFSNLAPGVYYFFVNIMAMNQFGAMYSFDRPNQKIYFEILPFNDEVKIEWKRNFMGSVRLKQIKLLDN